MRRFRSVGWAWVAAIISLCSIGGCGGHRPAGQSTFVARVILTPVGNGSVQVGSFIIFTATASNAAGSNVRSIFTFDSSDTSILNIAPNGAGCAGRWDAAFTTCSPGATGVVTVTASTQGGATSPPTYVFVHPPIDNITVKGVLLDSLPIQQPCLSQGQSMTVEAHAFSQGSDITASVGPFTFSANNSSVVNFTPVVNIAYNFATNQTTAKAVNPGLTYIYASASGVSSDIFVQPSLYNGASLNFFETCPVQNITLQLGPAGSQQSGQTSFAVSKGTSENVTAIVTDVFGNQLSKVPLTWTSSQPGSVSAASGCLQSCTVTTPLPGSGSVTASCSPPTCNAGFPTAPAGISAPFIPLPVYTTTAISGVVSGATSPNVVLATSLDCANEAPSFCTTGIYSFSTSRAAVGTATGMPAAPNSLISTLAGDKIYVGSNFGAQLLNPSNLGTQTGAFTPLGTVTGRALAVSTNGQLAIFSDTFHTPNQVYVVNAANVSSPSITALNISGASAAAFSQDGLKAYIYGVDDNGNPNLYLYSSVQALQVIPLPPLTSVSSIVFSTNGAFAYVVEPSLAGGGPAVSVFNTCDNQLYTDSVSGQHEIPLAGPPIQFKALPDGLHFIALESDGSLEYITASITPIPTVTLTQPPTAATALCPMTVSHTVPRKINLGQGTIRPINFFVSADGGLLYVLSRDRSSILVYDFGTGAVTGIQLIGATNPTPIAADMTVDAGTILVAGSDGLLHQVSTTSGGVDQFQLAFPNLANFPNSFCTFDPASGPCSLDFVLAKP